MRERIGITCTEVTPEYHEYPEYHKSRKSHEGSNRASFMRKMFFSLAGLILVLPFSLSQSEAAKFANQFVEFELPPNWQCNLEGAEWVCQSGDDAKIREAIIVLAAKLKGDQDSLDQYLAYLKANKPFTTHEGKPIKSESKYAKTVKINDHAWVDSLHYEGELPRFYTRYLATVKEDIGVLVTYSVQADKYQDYLNEFETLTRTLKVFRNPGGINAAPKKDLFADSNIPQHISQNTVFPDHAPPVDLSDDSVPQSTPTAAKKGNDGILFPLLLIAAVAGYLFWRRKQARG